MEARMLLVQKNVIEEENNVQKNVSLLCDYVQKNVFV